MHLTVYDQASAFVAAADTFLKVSEAENNLVFMSAARMVASPAVESPRAYLATVENEGPIVAAAVHGSAGGILVTRGPPSAFALIASDMAARAHEPTSVVGPLEACEAFAREWASHTGQGHSLRFHLRHYGLLRQPSPPAQAARGSMRSPRAEDHALLIAWARAFIDEVGLGDESVRACQAFARRLEHGTVRVWDDDGVVSLAGYGEAGTDVARIAPVYTPSRHRRKSYASALVAALARELLDRGKRAVFLTTDVANPTSNSIYRKIGFEPAADHYHFDFLRPAT